MVLLYGRAGHLTPRNGGFRPGQQAKLFWVLVFSSIYYVTANTKISDADDSEAQRNRAARSNMLKEEGFRIDPSVIVDLSRLIKDLGKFSLFLLIRCAHFHAEIQRVPLATKLIQY